MLCGRELMLNFLKFLLNFRIRCHFTQLSIYISFTRNISSYPVAHSLDKQQLLI